MTTTTGEDLGRGHDVLIRLGGVAIVVALGIHVVLNVVLKEMPPEAPTAVELQEYLTREAGTWAVVHGVRYLAFACIVVFSAGLFVRTCCTRAVRPTGWGVVGLLGTAMWVTSGVVTNGIEMLAFLGLDLVAQQQELFWLLYRLTRVLFTAEIGTWSITILGFCVAGWSSATIPRWMAAVGLLAAAAGLLSSTFVVSVINGGWATTLIDLTTLTSLVWFLCVGVYMGVRG